MNRSVTLNIKGKSSIVKEKNSLWKRKSWRNKKDRSSTKGNITSDWFKKNKNSKDKGNTSNKDFTNKKIRQKIWERRTKNFNKKGTVWFTNIKDSRRKEIRLSRKDRYFMREWRKLRNYRDCRECIRRNWEDLGNRHRLKTKQFRRKRLKTRNKTKSKFQFPDAFR